MNRPSQNQVKRPSLRYHGGKWKLAKWIISYFPEHRTYVEPFGGAGSILLQKPRSYAEIINDLDENIINYFRVLRDPVSASELKRLLEMTPFARVEFENAYEPSDDPIECARRLVIRSFMGFGSAAHNSKFATGFRANSNRSGSTPAHDWGNFPENINNITRRLQGVVIENRPAESIIKQHDGENTLIYADPPYMHDTRSKRQNQNYCFEMSDQDHATLADQLNRVDGMVIISGYRNDAYDYFYKDWKRIDKATFADGANKRVESLWLNANLQGKIIQDENLL
jgi:DNA adenine methylase